MRTIDLTIEGDALIPSDYLAGQTGEHQDTALTVTLPEEWADCTCTYRFLAANGRHYQTMPLTAPVSFALPQALMVAGELLVYLDAREGYTVHRTGPATLRVEESPDWCGVVGLAPDPYEGLIEASLQEFADTLDELRGQAEDMAQLRDDMTAIADQVSADKAEVSAAAEQVRTEAQEIDKQIQEAARLAGEVTDAHADVQAWAGQASADKTAAETAAAAAKEDAASALESRNAVDAAAAQVQTNADLVAQNTETVTEAAAQVAQDKAAAEEAAEKAIEAAEKAVSGTATAENVSYDPTESGLGAANVQSALDELAAKIIIVANPESWAGVQSLIRAGWAQKVFAVGDQLECNHKTYGKLVWDVIGFDMDAMSIGAHSMTLQLHSLINETLTFDTAEAIYYAETGLDPGTYYITITGQDWYPADNGVSYQFTLTKPLPAGGQLVLSATFNAPLEGKSIVSYADNTTNTAIETAILTQGTGGVNLGVTDGTGAVNHIQCALFGSNDYTQSDMRLFLNGTASTEWTASNKFSRRPAWVTVSSRRFTEGLDEDFLEVVGETPKLFARNTVTGDGGIVTFSDRFFLLSNSEVYGTGENEGDPYPYYADYSSLSAPGNGIDANRTKYNASAKADYWVLRSARRDNASSCNRVYPAGNITSGVASTTSGIVPACCIY